MDSQLAHKIISEIEKFSDVKCSIIGDLGEVIARTKSFDISHPQLNIRSPKTFRLEYAQKEFGYLYIDEKNETLKQIGKVIKSMAELIIQQDYETQLLTSDEKRTDQVAYDFLYTKNINPDDFSRVLGSFGIDLSLNRTALFIEICDPDYLLLNERAVVEGERERIIARTKRSLESILKAFYTQHTQNVIFYLGSRNFLALKDMGDDPDNYRQEFKKTLGNLHYNIEAELGTKITIGVGDFKSGLDGLRESFVEARTALKFGEQTWGADKIYHYDNFGVVAPLFSGANKDNIYFSKDIIKKITAHEGLQETLLEFLDNELSLGKTAQKLKIHRNTLVYRLGRIEELTNLDPRVFNDAFQLKLALVLDKYHD